MRLGIRARITAALVGLVVGAVGVLGLGAYVIARAGLRSQLERRAVDDAQFVAGVLAPVRLGGEGSPNRLRGNPILDDLQRSTDGFAITVNSKVVQSSGAIFAQPLPAEMLSLVDADRIARTWTRLSDGREYVLVGARRPGADPAFFLYEDASDTSAALRTLRNALAGGGLVVLVFGAALARLVARRVIKPVATASDASQRIERGDLSTRVEVTSRDEFGRWAETFNAMAASLESTVAELRHTQDEQRRFVADVSHELRTPLTALVNEATLLQPHIESLPSEARRVGELLVSDVARLRALVEDLLEISRLDAGSESNQSDIIDPQWLSSFVARRTPTARVTIGDSRPYPADRRRLERIVGNLLDNAVAHGGDPIDVVSDQVDDRVTIRVADRGPGVPSAALESMFSRFAKADDSRSTAGSGLGLAIARAHASALEGSLTASNRDGGGLVVLLTIPGGGRDADPTLIAADL